MRRWKDASLPFKIILFLVMFLIGQITVNEQALAVTFNLGNGKPCGSTPFRMVTGDFNRDHNLDFAVTNFGTGTGTVTILLGNNIGDYSPSFTCEVGQNPISIDKGDFNKDGFLDLVVSNFGENTVSILFGKGDGNFLPEIRYIVGSKPDGIVVEDFDGDENLDIVTANSNSSSISILLGNGDGTFKPKLDILNHLSIPKAIVANDFSRDGKIDLAVTDIGNDKVIFFAGNGDGSFNFMTECPVGRTPMCIAVGELNGDQKLDVVVGNYASNDLTVLIGKGDGTFNTGVVYTAGSQPWGVTINDFDGDSKQDIVASNYGGGNVMVFSGKGDGSFLSGIPFLVGNSPIGILSGDFDGDRTIDIATANYGSSTISILSNTTSSSGSTAADVPFVYYYKNIDVDARKIIITIKGNGKGVPITKVKQEGDSNWTLDSSLTRNELFSSSYKFVIQDRLGGTSDILIETADLQTELESAFNQQGISSIIYITAGGNVTGYTPLNSTKYPGIYYKTLFSGTDRAKTIFVEVENYILPSSAGDLHIQH